MSNIDPSDDLCFVLGPQPGYNREVLLWDASQWRIPSTDLVNRLFSQLDLPAVAAEELRDFGVRRATPVHGAAQTRLRCAVLSASRFASLASRIAETQATMFRFHTHRDIVAKRSCFDWQTVGMLLYTFEHLDR